MMDCAAYRDLMVADLDGALSPSEEAAARAHLAQCAACRTARALEAEFAALLRRPGRIMETPVLVRERIVTALAKARRPAPARTLSRAAVAAAGLLAAVALWTVLPAARADFVRPVALDYRLAATARLHLDLETEDPRALAAYFDTSGRFDFPADVLDLRTAGYRLVGGAIREVGGHILAVSVYASGAEYVVCHRFRADGTWAGRAVPGYYRSAELVLHVRNSAGVVCCLTSRMSPAEFERRVLAQL